MNISNVHVKNPAAAPVLAEDARQANRIGGLRFELKGYQLPLLAVGAVEVDGVDAGSKLSREARGFHRHGAHLGKHRGMNDDTTTIWHTSTENDPRIRYATVCLIGISFYVYICVCVYFHNHLHSGPGAASHP